MAIINQHIRNGVCTISKPGQYFSLVSASGIVRVKLRKAGTTVFDSKMWVGMNLPTPIPFDDIEIYGDDGGIQIWAGNVSLTQSSTVLKGASAIRTNQISVLGERALTGADITRTAVRLRANGEIFVGGAGVAGTGWRLTPGQVEELPIQGVIYGYKKLPELDISKAISSGTAPELFPADAVGQGKNHYHVSDDGRIRMLYTGLTTTLNGAWLSVDHGVTWTAPAWASDAALQGRWYKFVYSRERKTLYLARMAPTSNAITVFYSNDDGQTFNILSGVPIQDLSGSTRTDVNLGNLTITGNLMQCACAHYMWGLNLDTLEAYAEVNTRFKQPLMDAGATSSAVRFFDKAIWTSNDRLQGAFTAGEKLYFTTDGGLSFTNQNMSSILYLLVDSTGQHLIARNRDRQLRFSNDGGATWIDDLGGFGELNISQVFVNYYKDIWLISESGKIYAFYRVGDVYRYDVVNVVGAQRGGSQTLSPHGVLYQSPDTSGASGAEINLSIDGDLSPVLVEVMELLA